MPATDSHQPLKRKRVVTSCVECHRRKQKCDRKHPCDNCLTRNVASKCFYTSLTPRPKQSIRPGDELASSHVYQAEQDKGTASQDVGDLGYSLVARSNAFVGLNQVLRDEDEFQVITAAHNRPHFLSSALEGNIRDLTSKLPPRPIIEELSAIFFDEVNWHYFILERFYFDDMLSRWQASVKEHPKYLKPDSFSLELQYFPAVIFQILAVTLQFLPSDAPVLSRLPLTSSESYSNMGDKIVTLLGRQHGVLTAVQADFLRTSWLKNFGRGIESWHSVGNAIRQAQELGLHRHREIQQTGPNSIDETLSVFWYEEYKKRIWLNLFVWDSLMAMILGRPRAINADDCDAKPPIDCNIPRDPSKTVPMTIQPGESHNGPTTVSASLFRYALAKKVHEMRALKADKPHPKDYSVVRTLHDQVISLMDNVPPFLRPKNPDTSWDSEYPYLPQQREEILIMANLFLMTLHRPHILANSESRKAALQAALATLESQQRFFGQISKHHYKLFGLAFYTIDASILLSIIMSVHPPRSPEAEKYIDHILQQAMERLSHIQPYNAIAKSGLDILQRCYHKLKGVTESLSDTSGMMSASRSHSPPRSGLRDIRRELMVEPQEGSQSDPYLSTTDVDFDLPTLEFPVVTNTFDQAFWLEQLDQIQSFPSNLSDPDMIWESVI